MNHKLKIPIPSGQKIGYIILGAVIMLIGMSIDNLTSSPVTAQNDGEITCQKLTFVDETGKPLFYLETVNGSSISEPNRLIFEPDRLSIFKPNVIHSNNRVPVATELMRLSGSSTLSELFLLNPNGKEGVGLRSASLRNSVFVFNHEGKVAVSLASSTGSGFGIDENYVRIFNNEDEAAVRLEARMKNAAWYAEASPREREITSESNGIYISNNTPTSISFNGRTTRNSASAISLVSSKRGNKVTVYKKAPKVVDDFLNYREYQAVKLGTTEHGGRIDVFNKQGKNRAAMSVNEYGNGAVSTWDKNGYRLR